MDHPLMTPTGNVRQLIATCRLQNIRIRLLDGDQLKITAPDGPVDPALLQQLKQQKQEIIAFLKEAMQKNVYEGLEQVAAQPYYVISPAQKRLWVLSQFRENKSNYHIPAAFVFNGPLDLAALERALFSLIRRHEILRTTFITVEGEPWQQVHEVQTANGRIAYVDLRGQEDQQQKAAQLAKEEAQQPFDLEKGPLFRVKVLQLEETHFILLFTMHHIISDGWSVKILIRDFEALYDAACNGHEALLPPLTVQYKDYAAWINRQLSGKKLDEHRSYWQHMFRYKPDVLDLPVDFPRPAVMTNNGNTLSTMIAAPVAEGLQLLAQQSGASLFMVLVALVKTLLYRYTGQEDITVGSPIAGRMHPDLEDQVGFYLNNLVLRTQFSAGQSFLDLLSTVKTRTLDAYEHQLYPFDRLVDELGLAVDRSRSPLFDVVVVLQNTDLNLAANGNGDMTVNGYDTGYRISTADLRLEFAVLKKGILLNIDYNTDLFRPERIRAMLQHVEQLAAAVIQNPEQPLHRYDYLSAVEKDHLLHGLNNTTLPVPPEATLVSLFNEKAAAMPEQPAVIFGDTVLSYRSLNEQSNRLAHYLLNKYEVQQGEVVGVMVERSEKLLIALLGILKAGGAYLPIDPKEPELRKAGILRDASPRVLITETAHVFTIGMYNCALFAIDSQLGELGTPATDPGISLHPDHLAYIIYTSGSTGAPKGVAVPHRGAVNVTLDHIRRFSVERNDVNALFFPASFDASVFMIFMTLFSGASLLVLDEEIIHDPMLCLPYLKKSNTTIAAFPAAYLNLISPQELSFLRVLISGGEAPNYAHALACSEYVEHYNAYGPTECSVCIAVKKIGGDDRQRQLIPVGSPVANMQIVLLDAFDALVPVGITGEICVAGAGLAAGYLNNPAMTASRFLPHPFLPGARLYRTGDLGQWSIDGQLVFMGRKDRQVKIRGYRMELGEIEHMLLQNTDIEEVYVKVITDSHGSKELAAYYTSGEDLSDSGLRAFLLQRLPPYMVPHFFIRLDKFPLTANGKIAAAELPLPEELATKEEICVAPRNELEAQLLLIWKEQLGREQIGVMHNFFMSGGDSIKAIRVANAVNKATGTAIEVKEMFEYQDIASLSSYIAGKKGTPGMAQDRERAAMEIAAVRTDICNDPALSSLLPDDWEDIYPISDIQKGMVFYTLMNPANGVYHDQMYYQFRDPAFDIGLFKKAVMLLVEKHAIFRTSFHPHEFGEPVQIVHRADVFVPDVEYVNLLHLQAEEKKSYLENFLAADRKQSFNFTRPGIWRLRLFHIEEQEYGFLLIGHHAVIDGWSDASLRTELSNIYMKLKEDAGYRPEPLKTTYRDYVIDQHLCRQDNTVRTFWINYLNGYVRSQLPLHRPNKVWHGPRQQVSCLFTFGADLNRDIWALAEKLEVNVKSICLAAFVYLVKLTTNATEATLGLLTNGRPSLEGADEMLGCFLNTVPFRQQVNAGSSWGDLIREVHQNIHQTKLYDKLPLPAIIETVGEETTGNNPIFDYLYNFVNFHIIKEERTVTELTRPLIRGFGETNTLFDLIVNSAEHYTEAYFSSYADLYTQEELDNICRYYRRILDCFVHATETAMHTADVMGKDELAWLTGGINDTATDYPREKTIDRLWEEQVEKTPYAVAVWTERQCFTYEYINARANRLASYLQEAYHVRPGDLVGLMLDRNEWMITGILAVLKTGAGYVPVDPEHPAERKRLILGDANVKVLITVSDYMLDAMEYYQGALMACDLQTVELEQYPAERPQGRHTPDAVAYLMYTSGSTGVPKGVAVMHSNVVRLVKQTNYVLVMPGDRLLQLSNYAFDGSVFDLFAALLNGGAVYMLNRSTLLSMTALSEYIKGLRPNIMFITTALFNQLAELTPECFRPFDKIFFGGEDPSLHHVRRALQQVKNKQVLVHVYGPTEGTTFSTYYEIKELPETAAYLPIGYPLANTEVYVLDETGDLLPPGVEGEICLAGEGLAKEYRGDQILTQQKFVHGTGLLKGKRLYRTGDLGRLEPDNGLVFRGRRDNQVKLRGHRIELGEIEQALLKQPAVSQVFVTLGKNRSGEKYLVAYYTGEELEQAVLRQYLQPLVPDYMIPSWFVWMQELPLNMNGKIARQQLPEPGDDAAHKNKKTYAPARNATEARLVRIWEQVLDRAPVGIYDNFFELGGHSLKATQLAYHISREMLTTVQLKDIFATPTVADIAALIDHAEAGVYAAIRPLEEQDHYSLSHAQKRLWLHQQHGREAAVYIIPGAYRLEGALDLPALQQAFHMVINRHESLRTCFVTVQGIPRQQVRDAAVMQPEWNFTDCRNVSTGQLEETVSAAQQHISFDLEKGPLLKINLFQVTDTGFILLAYMHHIVADGWSMGILLSEISTCYEYCTGKIKEELTSLKIHYKDYTAWHNAQLSGPALKHLQAYWHQQFSDPVTPLDLMTDYERPAEKTYAGADLRFTVDPVISKRLQEMALQHNASLFMILLAAIKVLFYKYTGQRDLVIGTPIAGREHADLERQIGFYLNTLALRTKLDSAGSIMELITQVKHTTLQAFAHQAYPFDRLLEELQPDQEAGRSPLFDIMLVLQNMDLATHGPVPGSQDVTVAGYQPYSGMRATKYDMTFFFKEAGDQLLVNIAYNTALFSHHTIEACQADLRYVLQMFTESPEMPVSDLILTSAGTEGSGHLNAFIN